MLTSCSIDFPYTALVYSNELPGPNAFLAPIDPCSESRVLKGWNDKYFRMRVSEGSRKSLEDPRTSPGGPGKFLEDPRNYNSKV